MSAISQLRRLRSAGVIAVVVSSISLGLAAPAAAAVRGAPYEGSSTEGWCFDNDLATCTNSVVADPATGAMRLASTAAAAVAAGQVNTDNPPPEGATRSGDNASFSYSSRINSGNGIGFPVDLTLHVNEASVKRVYEGVTRGRFENSGSHLAATLVVSHTTCPGCYVVGGRYFMIMSSSPWVAQASLSNVDLTFRFTVCNTAGKIPEGDVVVQGGLHNSSYIFDHGATRPAELNSSRAEVSASIDAVLTAIDIGQPNNSSNLACAL